MKVNTFDNNHRNALFYAVEWRHAASASFLLERGSDVACDADDRYDHCMIPMITLAPYRAEAPSLVLSEGNLVLQSLLYFLLTLLLFNKFFSQNNFCNCLLLWCTALAVKIAHINIIRFVYYTLYLVTLSLNK